MAVKMVNCPAAHFGLAKTSMENK